MNRPNRFLTAMLTFIMLLSICRISYATLPFPTEEIKSIAVCTPDGKTVLSENSKEGFDVAGLTRLAPMLVVSRAIEDGTLPLSKTVSVSSEAARVPGPTAFLEANEKISVEALYKSAVMISAGDALYALSEAIFGSSAVFVEKINTALSELGIAVTYTSPMGDNMSLSALELCLVGAELAKCKTFLAYSTCYMDEITHENGNKTELVNPNRLIRDLPGCSGLATGSSATAGYCAVISVNRGDSSYICAVIGAKNSADRFAACKNALEYACATYTQTSLASKGDVIIPNARVTGGLSKKTDLVAIHDLSLQTEQGSGDYSCVENIPDTLIAPLTRGDVVGTIDYVDTEGNVLATLELTVCEDIPSACFAYYFELAIRMWTGSCD